MSAKQKKNNKEDENTEPGSNMNKESIEEMISQKTTATIYVEGIPYSADEGDLVTFFTPCGTVKSVRLPRYQDSGRIRGYGHVVFDVASSVDAALKLDGEYLKGRYLHIKRAEPPRAIESFSKVPKKVKGCRTVFVKNLPYDIEEETLKNVFSSCGEIVSVRLATWNQSKRSKGFGYVEFLEDSGAEAATKKNGMKIGDRMVLVDYETGAPKASFRLPTGQYYANHETSKELKAKKKLDKEKTRRHKPY